MSDDFMDIMRKMYREENNSDTGRGGWFLPPEIAQGIADGTYTVLKHEGDMPSDDILEQEGQRYKIAFWLENSTMYICKRVD